MVLIAEQKFCFGSMRRQLAIAVLSTRARLSSLFLPSNAVAAVPPSSIMLQRVLGPQSSLRNASLLISKVCFPFVLWLRLANSCLVLTDVNSRLENALSAAPFPEAKHPSSTAASARCLFQKEWSPRPAFPGCIRLCLDAVSGSPGQQT